MWIVIIIVRCMNRTNARVETNTSSRNVLLFIFQHQKPIVIKLLIDSFTARYSVPPWYPTSLPFRIYFPWPCFAISKQDKHGCQWLWTHTHTLSHTRAHSFVATTTVPVYGRLADMREKLVCWDQTRSYLTRRSHERTFRPQLCSWGSLVSRTDDALSVQATI